MSTNGAILRSNGVGVYHHSDSYPRALGKFLWDSFHGFFKQDLKSMLKLIIDDHPAGWSTLYLSDFSVKPRGINLNPEFNPDGTRTKKYANAYRVWTKTPKCYCHGIYSDSANPIYLNELDGIPWAYIFNEQRNTITILDVYNRTEMDFSLFDKEPDWTHIECGEGLERCTHYAWVHFPEAKEYPYGDLSTDVYLGRKQFDFRHVVAFVISGERYSATGNGFHSCIAGRIRKQSFPPDCWISTVTRIKTNERLEIPVAKITKQGYKPYKGVTWVYPPTKYNTKETLRSR